MRFLFTRVFWGIVIILLGLLALLDNFGIDIHFGRYFWPVILIILGVEFLTKPMRHPKVDAEIIFNDAKREASDEQDNYEVIFGQAQFDFRHIKPENKEYKIEVVFGKATVLIKKDTPVKIISSTAFGEVSFPGGKSPALGDKVYMTEDAKEMVVFRTSAVFGAIEILEK